jgi:hypothetical protein
MEYDDLLEDMKKSRKEKNLFSNVLTETMTNKEFADKANALMEAAENQKKAEKATRRAIDELMADGIEPSVEKPSSAQVPKPGTTSLEDDENDLIFTPRKTEQEFFAGAKKLLNANVKKRANGQTKKNTVDREGMIKALAEETWKRRDQGAELTKWWMAVYKWMREKEVITLRETVADKHRERYREFAKHVVLFCQDNAGFDRDEGIDEKRQIKRISDRMQKVTEEDYKPFLPEVTKLLGKFIVEVS